MAAGSRNLMAVGLMMKLMTKGPRNQGESFLDSVLRGIFLEDNQTFLPGL